MSIPAGGPLIEVPLGAIDLATAIADTAVKIREAMDDERTIIEDRFIRAAELVWAHLYGQLRGRIPSPVPFDLAGVAVSAGMRICEGFADTGAVFLNGGQYESQAEFRPWSGFLLPELLIIWRYRRRTV